MENLCRTSTEQYSTGVKGKIDIIKAYRRVELQLYSLFTSALDGS
jgi:hypothetical protein